MKIKVSINDGPSVEVDTVRVFVEGLTFADAHQPPGGNEYGAQLQTNFTGEGVVRDIVEDVSGQVVRTESATYDESIQALFDSQ